MPGQRLGGSRRDSGPFQVGNEGVPVGVEIGEQPLVVLILQDIRILLRLQPLPQSVGNLGMQDLRVLSLPLAVAGGHGWRVVIQS